MRAIGLAIGIAVAACGGERADPIDKLARAVPATAERVVAVDGPRIRSTWLASAARSLAALVPADRGCIVDAALAADRAVVAELATGRIVVLAARKVDCRALSQIAPGLWLATLGGAPAPRPGEPRLVDRPDYPAVRRALVAGPIAGVAPDGVPAEHVVWATATIRDATSATLTLELDTSERATATAAALRTAAAAAADRLGDGAPIVRAIEVSSNGHAVIANLRTDARTAAAAGPIVIVAAVAAVAARAAEPAAPVAAPSCAPTRWPVTCANDGTRFTIKEALRPTVEAAVLAARPSRRVVGGQPAGVRINDVAPDSVLAALGLHTGDIVIALHGRRLDTPEALDHCAEALRTTDVVDLTVLRGPRSFELQVRVE